MVGGGGWGDLGRRPFFFVVVLVVVTDAMGGGCKDGIPPIAGPVGGEVVVVVSNAPPPPVADDGGVLFRVDARLALVVGGDVVDSPDFIIDVYYIGLLVQCVSFPCRLTSP